ncbi:MAG: CRISPR-associated endonuclease Cas2 [bacterium]|nr:CRISPR-associated endonuclease Cas2 [bacterium]
MLAYRRSTKTEKALRAMRSGPSTTDKVFHALFGLDLRSEAGSNTAPSESEVRRFYSFLSHLKHQGLIERRKDRKAWELTEKGKARLVVFDERERFSFRSTHYSAVQDNVLRVVIFDIPENARHKRAWLRVALLALGFSMCQQSVWMGKRKIPRKFLEDLRDRELLQYVHIFEISKRGSLSSFL